MVNTHVFILIICTIALFKGFRKIYVKMKQLTAISSLVIAVHASQNTTLNLSSNSFSIVFILPEKPKFKNRI